MNIEEGVQEVQQDEQQTHICAGNMTCKFLKKELKRTGHLTSGIKADLVDCVLKVITTRRMWSEDLATAVSSPLGVAVARLAYLDARSIQCT